MANRPAPPLLEPYLGLPPEAALVLLTGVLGASTNWLVLRYLQSVLAAPGPDVGVLLVSFLRDRAFWAHGAARLVRRRPASARGS